MKRNIINARILFCVILALVLMSNFWRGSDGFSYHDDGTVTLSKGYTAHGFYLPNGRILDEGKKLNTENGVLRGTVNMQQNLSGTVAYGLLLMTDFLQQDFYVEGEKFRFYKFTLTGNDETNISIELPVSEDDMEFEYLIVRSPDVTGFANGDSLDWDKLFEARNAYSYHAVLNERSDSIGSEEKYLYRLPEELVCEQAENKGGFELFRDRTDMEVFGEAFGGERVVVKIGVPTENTKECRMIAFCDWEQVPLRESASVIVYPNTEKIFYDEIVLPKPDKDAVYQVFLFEIGEEHSWRTMNPSFRMDLKVE